MVTSRVLGVAVTAAVIGLSTPALAATPTPQPGSPPTPRCHVVPGQKPPAAAGGTVAVFIPRVVCSQPVAHRPPPHAAQGGAEGGASGQVPFTGADLARWALAAVLALGGGTAIQLLARRRRASR